MTEYQRFFVFLKRIYWTPIQPDGYVYLYSSIICDVKWSLHLWVIIDFSQVLDSIWEQGEITHNEYWVYEDTGHFNVIKKAGLIWNFEIRLYIPSLFFLLLICFCLFIAFETLHFRCAL